MNWKRILFFGGVLLLVLSFMIMPAKKTSARFHACADTTYRAIVCNPNEPNPDKRVPGCVTPVAQGECCNKKECPSVLD